MKTCGSLQANVEYITTALILLLASVLIGAALPVQAAEQEWRQYGQHQHGAAELKVVVEADSLLIELSSPAVNIVGFESWPHREDQKQAVNKALALLRKPHELFVLPPDCRVGAVTVESELDPARPATDSGHSDFDASYQIHCEDSVPQALELKLFEHFAGLERLDAAVLAPSGQSLQVLDPAKVKLRLGQ